MVCSDSTSELSDVDTDSECVSINDISQEEIEELKNKIKSKGTALFYPSHSLLLSIFFLSLERKKIPKARSGLGKT